MSRKKNALRGHFIAPYTNAETKPADEAYLELAKWITNISDDTDEASDDYADYAGDGTPSTDVTSVSEKWTVEGTYDPEDPAQKLIAGMKRKLGDDRKVWHKVVQTDGVTAIGVATVSEIKAGSGEASEYEAFGCILNYDQIPEETNTGA
ncbi:hypothetical protein M2454_001906 [Aequitasia blattaphilus]|uniref:Phage tail protein n=1 Tax=Aequitasia blattaphilus TaxID=2949332 RepID=A0ABT1EAF1_9FIRM|nr:phage tail protein [Aequitasia blattaphilus]MCP1102594.1 phage tail protein [Aequitasia blattaphilus]MCR8615234.1 phage tail protein [Aequitasia blattaphilus]